MQPSPFHPKQSLLSPSALHNPPQAAPASFHPSLGTRAREWSMGEPPGHEHLTRHPKSLEESRTANETRMIQCHCAPLRWPRLSRIPARLSASPLICASLSPLSQPLPRLPPSLPSPISLLVPPCPHPRRVGPHTLYHLPPSAPPPPSLPLLSPLTVCGLFPCLFTGISDVQGVSFSAEVESPPLFPRPSICSPPPQVLNLELGGGIEMYPVASPSPLPGEWEVEGPERERSLPKVTQQLA